MGNRVFLHAYEVKDWNQRSYSLKLLKAKKRSERVNVYFEPILGHEIDLMDFSSTVQRGKKFFTVKDGFLFGAMVELQKMGKIVKDEL